MFDGSCASMYPIAGHQYVRSARVLPTLVVWQKPTSSQDGHRNVVIFTRQAQTFVNGSRSQSRLRHIRAVKIIVKIEEPY